MRGCPSFGRGVIPPCFAPLLQRDREEQHRMHKFLVCREQPPDKVFVATRVINLLDVPGADLQWLSEDACEPSLFFSLFFTVFVQGKPLPCSRIEVFFLFAVSSKRGDPFRNRIDDMAAVEWTDGVLVDTFSPGDWVSFGLQESLRTQLRIYVRQTCQYITSQGLIVDEKHQVITLRSARGSPYFGIGGFELAVNSPGSWEHLILLGAPVTFPCSLFRLQDLIVHGYQELALLALFSPPRSSPPADR